MNIFKKILNIFGRGGKEPGGLSEDEFASFCDFVRGFNRGYLLDKKTVTHACGTISAQVFAGSVIFLGSDTRLVDSCKYLIESCSVAQKFHIRSAIKKQLIAAHKEAVVLHESFVRDIRSGHVSNIRSRISIIEAE